MAQAFHASELDLLTRRTRRIVTPLQSLRWLIKPQEKHSDEPRPAERANTGNALVVIMGPTGAGKSTFIRSITGQDVKIGHGLSSETAVVQTFDCLIGSQMLTLVDTPGFDDTYTSDHDTLKEIADWLKKTYDNGRLLNGILYLQPITKNRVEGSSLRSLSLLEKLCGPGNFGNVLLVTTFWNKVSNEVGVQRERELVQTEGFWRLLKEQGARVERMAQDYGRFHDILLSLAHKPEITLQIQEELHAGKALEETMAGLSIEAEVKKLKEEQAAKEARVRLIHANRLARQKEEAERRRQREADERHIRQQEEVDRLEKETSEQLERVRKMEEERERLRKAAEARLAKQARMAATKERDLKRLRAVEQARAKRRQSELLARDMWQLSLLQRRRINHDLDLFRLALSSGLTRILFWGIFNGTGMHDAYNTYVSRSPLNQWCDICCEARGIQDAVICHTCTDGNSVFNMCMKCWNNTDLGCMNHDHQKDYVIQPAVVGNRCRRAQIPNGLACDRCRADVQGLYFHCCQCDNDNFDICLACVLKQRGCRQYTHVLSWGVQKVQLRAGEAD